MDGNNLKQKLLYAIIDTGYVSDSQWEQVAEGLLAGGVDLLQVRAKGEPIHRVRELTARIQPLAANYNCPLIVNDHLEVALAFDEVGLHLGQDDMDIGEARRQLGPDRILGLSTHSVEQASKALQQADLLSYFAVGPLFPTPTKPDYPAVGLSLIKDVRALKPKIPFFCIGGIKLDNLQQVRQAGTERIVIVSELLQAENPQQAAAKARCRWYALQEAPAE